MHFVSNAKNCNTSGGAESTATTSAKKKHTLYAVYDEASGHIGVMPKFETTKLLVEHAVSQLRATSAALAALKMNPFTSSWTGNVPKSSLPRLHVGFRQ